MPKDAPGALSVDTTAAKPQYVLTSEEIAKIAAEESFRQQIRKELEGSDKKENKIWKALNSPLSLLIFSSVIIGGFGKLLSYEIESQKEREAQRKEIRKYLSEFEYRLLRLNQFSALLDTASTDGSKGYFLTGFEAVLNGDSVWYTPLDPDFKKLPLATLVEWFDINRIEPGLTNQIIIKSQETSINPILLYKRQYRDQLLSLFKEYAEKIGEK